MTLKHGGLRLPGTNAAGFSIGGGSFFLSADFDIGTPSTWDGIAIDPDGTILGTSYRGITGWSGGDLCFHIDIDGTMTISADGLIHIDTSNAASGLIVGNMSITTAWLMHNNGLFGYLPGSTESHAFALSSVTWQGLSLAAGDAVIGGYGSGAGLFWDQSAATLYVKGRIVDGLVTSSDVFQIDTTTTKKGLLVGDPVSGNGWCMHSNGLFGYLSGSTESHAFALASVTWQSQSLGAGDFILGSYGSGSGVFWDQSESELFIKIDNDGYILIDTTGTTTGLIVGAAATTTGWVINANGIFGYSGGSQIHGLISGSCWWQGVSMVAGDAVIGKYWTSSNGLFWNHAASTLDIKISGNGAVRITTSTTGKGLIVGTYGTTNYGWVMNAGGLFSFLGGTGASEQRHAFFLSAATWQGYSFGAGDVFIGKKSGAGLFYDESGEILYLYKLGDLPPKTDNTYNLGSSAIKWNTVYACNFLESCACYLGSDDYACLDLLRNFQPLLDSEEDAVLGSEGLPVLDKRSMPKWLTNFSELYDELYDESGETLSYEDYCAAWDDGDMEGYRSCRNIPHTIDLLIGAILELDAKLTDTTEKHQRSCGWSLDAETGEWM